MGKWDGQAFLDARVMLTEISKASGQPEFHARDPGGRAGPHAVTSVSLAAATRFRAIRPLVSWSRCAW